MWNKDTICAIATAPGGAIGIIRVSGQQAIQAVSVLFTPAARRDGQPAAPLEERSPYTLTFGQIREAEEVVDEVLVSLFRAPHSYTGEDSVEISCHGSAYILQRVLQLLLAQGCRLAAPGEFTQRAFLNGKMDLSQAEAVADLIASTSATTHRLAMSQMRGGFSRELSLLRERLLHFTSLVELELDFSDHEELEFADRSELTALADEIERVVSRLVHSFSVGNALKNGIPVAIIGETNVGKSTLLNALLNEERAIVSDIHGTTRDVIEDTVNLGGITFRFIDTAGIRQTDDTIENLGIERTYQKLEQAEIVLWMVDGKQVMNQPFAATGEQILPRCEEKKVIILINKMDMLTADEQTVINSQLSTLINRYSSLDAQYQYLSAKQRTGIDALQRLLTAAAALPEISQSDVIVNNLRHYEALSHALDAIHRVQDGLQNGLSGDFIAQDIRECIFHLSDIVAEGGITSEETLQNIFSHFCVGK